jgi:predicted RNA-binding protein with PUA-like domain
MNCVFSQLQATFEPCIPLAELRVDPNTRETALIRQPRLSIISLPRETALYLLTKLKAQQ